MFTFASINLNTQVPSSMPLFGPKTNKARGHVLLEEMPRNSIGLESAFKYLKFRKHNMKMIKNGGSNTTRLVALKRECNREQPHASSHQTVQV